MGYPLENLNEDERIIFDENPHWSFMLSSILMLILSIALTLAAYSWKPVAALAIGVPMFAFTVIGSIGRLLRWQTTEFVLTTDRLIVRHGIIGKNGKEIPLDRIMNISFHQSVLDRVLHTGDLVVESAGEQSQQVFGDVANPAKMQNKIYKAVDNIADGISHGRPDGLGEPMRRPPVRRGRNAPPPSGMNRPAGNTHAFDPRAQPRVARPVPSVADEIAKLAHLRDQGNLTDEEFAEAKRDLMEKY